MENKELQTRPVEGQEPAPSASRMVFQPLTDVVETEDRVLLSADLPGVEEKDVDVAVENGVLSIRGRVSEAETGHRAVYAEYLVGDFRRDLALPEDIDQSAIEAVLKDGVLRVSLPKAAAAKPRKIAVKVA